MPSDNFSILLTQLASSLRRLLWTILYFMLLIQTPQAEENAQSFIKYKHLLYYLLSSM